MNVNEAVRAYWFGVRPNHRAIRSATYQIPGRRKRIAGLEGHASLENGVAWHFPADFFSDAEPSGWRFHASVFCPYAEFGSGYGVTAEWSLTSFQCKPLIANRDMDICL